MTIPEIQPYEGLLAGFVLGILVILCGILAMLEGIKEEIGKMRRGDTE